MRVLSVLMIVGTLAVGGYTYANLIPRDGFPALELPALIVEAPHRLGDPAAADAVVTARLNEQLGSLDGVIEVQSQTTSDRISTLVVAASDADLGKLADAVRERLAAEELPAVVLPFSFETVGFDLALSSPELSGPDLDALASELADVLGGPDYDELILRATAERRYDAAGNQISFNRTGQRLDDGSFGFVSAAAITLQKPADIDSVTFSADVHKLLDGELRRSGQLPDHITVTTIADPAAQTLSQISGLQISLLQSLAVVAVMVLLLVSWRAAVVSVVFIPTVMAATILVLYVAGFTLNTISMFGLLLVLGLFVDDIIVVVESIDRERAEGRTGLDALRAALRRVGAADVMGSLTTIAVFAPLLFLPGLIGTFVRQLPLAVIVALTLSVLFALTAFLWLSGAMLREPTANRVDRGLSAVSRVGGRGLRLAGAANHRLVGGYLRSKVATTAVGLAGVVAIAVGTSFIARLDLNIFPSATDAPTLAMSATFNGARSIPEAEQIAAAMEQKILAEAGPDVEAFTYQHTDQLGAVFQLDLRDGRTLTSGQIAERLESAFEGDPSVSLSTDSGEEVKAARFAAASGDELAVLEGQVHRFVASQPEARFAAYAPVSDEVQRWDDSPVINAAVTFNKGADVSAFMSELPERAEADGLGISIDASAVSTTSALEEDQQRSFGSMGLILMLSIFVVAMLLTVQFRSFVLPGLILVAIPLSLPLLFPGLLSVGADLSMFVMLGISALIGIAVNNSIMLIDYANQEIRAGAEPVPAILSALRIRFRPLVTTTLTTVVGVFPLTTDLQFSGLAWTVIFGMISSTLLVLTVFPAYYTMVQTPRSALSNWRARRAAASQ